MIVRITMIRLAGYFATLSVIVVGSFFLMRITPGGPFDTGRHLDPATVESLRHHYGLDAPLAGQFWRYVAGLATGDLGPSYTYRDLSVSTILSESLPVSLLLVGLAFGLALAAGVGLGLLSAASRLPVADRAVRIGSTIVLAVPAVVLGPLLIIVFALTLRWLPASGWKDGPAHWILPVVTLATPFAAMLARLTRGAIAEVMASPHIRAARAYGLPPRAIAARALRGALVPIVSFAGPAAVAMLTGSVVVETMFGVPGIGFYFTQAALSRDYPLAMGAILLLSVLVVSINALVDLSYPLIDPRVGRTAAERGRKGLGH